MELRIILIILVPVLLWMVISGAKERMRLANKNKELESELSKYTSKKNYLTILEEDISLKSESLNVLNIKVDQKSSQNKQLKSEKEKLVRLHEKALLAFEKMEIDYFYDPGHGDEALSIDDGIYEVDDWNEVDSGVFLDQLKELKAKEKKSSKEGRANLNGYFPEIINDKYKEKVMKSIRKLVLRTFNGEADAAIAKVTYRNKEQTHKRIQKSFDDLQKLSSFFGCRISIPYLKYKLKEADLVYDYELKRQQEKEEQRAIAEQMREEEKVRREVEKAQKESALEEKKAQEALERAKGELESAHGEELTKLQEKMALLESKLKEAQENNQRATSMAQLTKSGHVYIISNIGSFGEDVYKIGMTRRLVPMDRVRELGDASVPFKFDVHAMIYSENAPELENILHKEFDNHRLNKVNLRKEFFKVELEKIKETVKKNYGEFKLTMLAEAGEYRKSLELKRKKLKTELSEETLL